MSALRGGTAVAAVRAGSHGFPTCGSIAGMKISVSLPQEDVAYVDEYASRTEADSRSAVIHAAIELLRAAELEAQYTEAFEEWDDGDNAAAWDRATGDGITHETW